MKALIFFTREGWSSLRRNPAASVAAVTAIGAVLFVLLILLLLSHNTLLLAERLRERKGLSVFIDPDLPRERVAELQQHVSGFSEVASVRLVSREEALRGIEEDLGTANLEATLGENPLPDVLLVTPVAQASGAAALNELAREIGAYEGVTDVIYGERWVEALDHGLSMARRADALTGGLATLAIVLVLGNTLRLLVLMREEQLAIMKVIGATDAFVRAPFVLAGVMLCVIGGLTALGFLGAAFTVTQRVMPGMRFLPPSTALFFLGGVAVVGLAGSIVTVEASIRHVERRGQRARA